MIHEHSGGEIKEGQRKGVPGDLDDEGLLQFKMRWEGEIYQGKEFEFRSEEDLICWREQQVQRP